MRVAHGGSTAGAVILAVINRPVWLRGGEEQQALTLAVRWRLLLLVDLVHWCLQIIHCCMYR